MLIKVNCKCVNELAYQIQWWGILVRPALSYFFALNHQNYSRWTVKYHDNLLKLEETHPEVYE